MKNIKMHTVSTVIMYHQPHSLVRRAADARKDKAEAAAEVPAASPSSSDDDTPTPECPCCPMEAPLPSIISSEGRASFESKWESWSCQPCNAQPAKQLVGYYAKLEENSVCSCKCPGCAESPRKGGTFGGAIKRGLSADQSRAEIALHSMDGTLRGNH